MQVSDLALIRDALNGFFTGTTLGLATDNFSYNQYGEVDSYQASYSGSSIFDVQYIRDDLGRITQKVETVEGVSTTYDYSYDTAGRLITVTKNGSLVSEYVYDANGNRITATINDVTSQGFYDLQDRMTSYGGVTYTYTANGELKTKADSSGVTSYEYDEFGNLIKVTLPDGALIEYVIDGKNRRVGKKINGVLVQSFLYKDDLNPIAELDGFGNVVSRFVYANKSNVPAYMIKESVTYRIVSDHLGSPRMVVDVATGAIVQHLDYDEFGVMINDTNPGFQPFGFAGGIYDQYTKLTRFGARDYDAQAGRWTSKDPIRFSGRDSNLYGYVLNNPVNWVDNVGLFRMHPGASAGCALAIYGIHRATGAFVPSEENDKKKHCVLSCIMMKGCGPFGAASAGIGKEILDLTGAGTPDMDDIYADAKGMACGLGGIFINCKLCCGCK